jgi:hypothetical protein
MAIYAWSTWRDHNGDPHTEPANVVLLPEALRFTPPDPDPPPAILSRRCQGCGSAYTPRHATGRCGACR